MQTSHTLAPHLSLTGRCQGSAIVGGDTESLSQSIEISLCSLPKDNTVLALGAHLPRAQVPGRVGTMCGKLRKVSE